MQPWINLLIIIAIFPFAWKIMTMFDRWAHRRDMRSGAWYRMKQDLF